MKESWDFEENLEIEQIIVITSSICNPKTTIFDIFIHVFSSQMCFQFKLEN